LGTSNNNRRAKYYELTRRGRLEIEIRAWRKLSDAVAQVLEMEPKILRYTVSSASGRTSPSR